jgi:hypothetical protein
MQANPSRYTLLASPSGDGPGLIVLPSGRVMTVADLQQAMAAQGYPPGYEGVVSIVDDDGSEVDLYVSN